MVWRHLHGGCQLWAGCLQCPLSVPSVWPGLPLSRVAEFQDGAGQQGGGAAWLHLASEVTQRHLSVLCGLRSSQRSAWVEGEDTRPNTSGGVSTCLVRQAFETEILCHLGKIPSQMIQIRELRF